MAAPSSVERVCGVLGETTPQWYLIHTKPLAERIAQENLERQGYATYLPLLALRTRRRQGLVESVMPLFPRYLFLQVQAGHQSVRPVHSTVGVCNIVRFGMVCAVVRDEVIEKLRARADPVSGLHRLRPRRGLAAGTVVRITAGPFDGLEAVFEREAGAERVVVLLKLLGQETAVLLSQDSIQLCG
jgi:transcriptional antiterminator RfaH